jgi:phage-related protein
MNIKFLFSKTYDFLFEQDDVSVEKISKSLGLLERYGNGIDYPHTKAVGKGIFELRVIGMRHIRIFFIYKNNEAVILHAIIKKTNSIPKKEIDYVFSLKNKLW